MIAKAEAEWEKVFARKQCHMNNLNAKLKHLKEQLRKLTVRKNTTPFTARRC